MEDRRVPQGPDTLIAVLESCGPSIGRAEQGPLPPLHLRPVRLMLNHISSSRCPQSLYQLFGHVSRCWAAWSHECSAAMWERRWRR